MITSPGSGKKFHSMWTFVDDVIDAFVLAIDKGKPNSTYIISGDDTLNVSQFLNVLAESCGRYKIAWKVFMK